MPRFEMPSLQTTVSQTVITVAPGLCSLCMSEVCYASAVQVLFIVTVIFAHPLETEIFSVFFFSLGSLHMVVMLSLSSSAPHAECRWAPNEGARAIPTKQCAPLCLKSVLRSEDTRVVPPAKFDL